MDAAVAPGQAGCVGEGRPMQCDIRGGYQARFHLRRAGSDDDREPEPVAAGEEPRRAGRGSAEVAVARRVLGERRGREGGGLVGAPGAAVDELGSLVRPAPGADLLSVKEVPDGGDRAYRVVCPLVVPGNDSGSNVALLRAKNILTSAPMPWRPLPWWSRRETYWSRRFQWPGGSSLFGPSAQYSEMTFCLSVRCALSSRISSACRR